MHETGPRSCHNHHFHLTPSHSDPPSPTSAGICSPTESPLASYVVQRGRRRPLPPEGARVLAHRHQVPLSALSPPSVSLGAVGGHFNSTTKIKFVPLPTIFSAHQAIHRGVRSIRVHTDRYLPSSGMQHRGRSTISDSLLHLPSLDNRPKTRLVAQEKALKRTREFTSRSGVLLHRVEQPFYMSGHRAPIVGKEEEVQMMEEERRVHFSKNATFFYGRGLAHHPVSSCGGREAVRRFEVRLNTALEQRGSHEHREDVVESEQTTDDCRGQTFLTETRTRTNV